MLSRTITKQITNVILTADLKQKVDASRFNQYPWGLYDLECYGGRCGYVKDNNIDGRVTVFLSGKLISIGAKSIKKATRQLYHAVALMANAGLIKSVPISVRIQNIVGMLDIKQTLDLIHLAKELPRSIYEPDQFPGLIHRTSIGPTLLIFSSGKIIVAGAKSEKEIDQISSMITHILV